MQRSSTRPPVFIQQTPGPGTRTRAPQVGQLHPTGARGPGVLRPVSAFSGPWLAQTQSGATEGPSQRACHSPLPPPHPVFSRPDPWVSSVQILAKHFEML